MAFIPKGIYNYEAVSIPQPLPPLQTKSKPLARWDQSVNGTVFTMRVGRIGQSLDAPIATTYLDLAISGRDNCELLHRALFRALNTWDDAPQWLHDLCDAIGPNPT